MDLVKKLSLCLVLICGSTATTLATSYRLDFSGQSSSGSYSGYFILDFDNPVDENPSDFVARYSNVITAASFELNGVDYLFDADPDGTVSVVNNSPAVGDYLGFFVLATNPDTLVADELAVNFQREDGTAFVDTSLPTSLNFADFDPYNLNAFLSTGVYLPIPAQSIPEVFVPLDSATFYPVPLPAGMLLLLSALITLTGVSRNLTIRE